MRSCSRPLLLTGTTLLSGTAIALPLQRTLPAVAIPASPVQVEFRIYDGPEAVTPLLAQGYGPGEFQLSHQGDTTRIAAELAADLPPDGLWLELSVDGEARGERVALNAATPGVTFALGNALDMDGNPIVNVATPASAGDAATKGYVDGATVATALALAANGGNCGTGQYAQGVDASGVAEGCTTDATNDTVQSSELDTLCALDGKILKRSGGSWACADDAVGTGDNLGNHIATQNIQLGSNWLSGDGGNEGIRVDAAGKVGIASPPGTANLIVGGFDGVLATGFPGNGAIPTEGVGIRMMWYPRKSAFRAGQVFGTEWNDVNIGTTSTAFGRGTTASGELSWAMGYSTEARGDNSAAMGYETIAESYAETVIGRFDTDYTPTAFGASTWFDADRLLVIGNGSSDAARSDALVMLKSGDTTLNGTLTQSSAGNPANLTLHQETGGNYARLRLEQESVADFWDVAAGGASNRFNIWFQGWAPSGANMLSLYSDCADTNPGNTNPLMQMVNGAKLTCGGAWTNSSDRAAKTAIQHLDSRGILDKVIALPISEWSYRLERGARHIGPMAQDFHAAFGLGSDDTSISTVDADGVALAAIQGLNAKLEAENRALKAELAAQQAELLAVRERLSRYDRLTEQVAALEARLELVVPRMVDSGN